MKKIWLMGGFGNVLFQILAFNVLLSKGEKVSFVKKLTEVNFFTKVIRWKIHQKLYLDLIDEQDYLEVRNIQVFQILIISFISKYFNFKFKKATFYNKKTQIEDYNSENVFGYFQDKFFLSKNQNLVLEMGKRLSEKYKLKDTYPIVVHYRKGDSDWAKKYSKYYNEIKTMLILELNPVLIVTDSVENASIFFKEIQGVKIISSKNALDDFKYLISSEKLYCAPSTFSWWAVHALRQDVSVVLPRFLVDSLGYYNNNFAYEIID